MNKALEGEFSDEEIGRFLILSNFVKSHCPGTETMRLPSAAGGLENSVRTMSYKLK